MDITRRKFIAGAVATSALVAVPVLALAAPKYRGPVAKMDKSGAIEWHKDFAKYCRTDVELERAITKAFNTPNNKWFILEGLVL